jgi:hypothetical protein
MAEIILNPDVEILDENDRKLYYLFRQAIDTKFLKAVQRHVKEEEHLYHICLNQYVNVRQLSLKQTIDQNSQQHHPKELLEQFTDQCEDELVEAIVNAIAVYRECERRGIRIK